MITVLRTHSIQSDTTVPHLVPNDSYGEGNKHETKGPVMTRELHASEKNGTLPAPDRRKSPRFVPTSEK